QALGDQVLVAVFATQPQRLFQSGCRLCIIALLSYDNAQPNEAKAGHPLVAKRARQTQTFTVAIDCSLIVGLTAGQIAQVEQHASSQASIIVLLYQRQTLGEVSHRIRKLSLLQRLHAQIVEREGNSLVIAKRLVESESPLVPEYRLGIIS